MSGDFIFLIGLFLSGSAINGLVFKRLPPWAIISTAFFVGSFNWVFVSLLFLVFLNGANPLYISIFVFAESLLCLAIEIRNRKEYSFNWNSFYFLMIYFFFFVGLNYLFVRINLTNASRDTLTYIAMGKEMEFHGLANFLWKTPSSIAYFASLLQTPSRFLGVDYLQNVQPMLSAGFLMFLLASAHYYFGLKIGKIRSNILMVFLGLFIFSSKLMQFMFSYIHSNNSSAYFLFLVLFCYYAYSEDLHEKSWLTMGGIFISCFCLLRVENTIICLLFLFLAFCFLKFSHEDNLRYILPYVVFSFFIDLSYLLSNILTTTNSMLDSAQLIALMAIEILMAFYFLFRKVRSLDKLIIKYLNWIVPIISILAVVFTFITKPAHMLENLLACISNLFITGGWGATWFIVFLTIALLWGKNKNDFASILKYFIPLYFLIIFLLGYFRNPYHTGWSDSANRIFVQIFFACLFFVITILVDGLKRVPEKSIIPTPGLDKDI